MIIDIVDALFYGFEPALTVCFFCRKRSVSLKKRLTGKLMLNLLGSIAVKTAPDEKILVAAQRAGNRLLWLPSKALASLKGTIKMLMETRGT